MPSVIPASTDDSKCLDTRQKVTQARGDLVSLAPSYAACYPQEAQDERKGALETRIADFKAQKQAIFDAEKEEFEGLLEMLRLSNRTQEPIEAYVKELKNEQLSLERENYRLQQQIRAGRRRFLDDDPQGGVGVGAIRTSDDRVMLFFWIAYALFLVTGLVVLFGVYGGQFGLETKKQKLGFGATVFLLLYGIAYWAVTRYA